ncbi:bifunctional 23S rRNA (guanine(2069)-N(7))-methyltransferase RlmK/23S rRNA (guanine(2445)-N(2))-methyltransferase RlmL [Entomospira nematocerorum]|uniref:Bifunctional 23S rRNA (Guanine(2069)-N(7))-methyltransferase RlmK/23S rRNA (Guanine(2445)-N(2))-methyltransferase RlmL n=1 Tax=Entomospira nematocerorum TaxID=2719987 RepID=A0A968GD31_9SPIO|nr:bifunctional 23S rRNA (guanine(2069)-N(7))-methyltransferase RlmK/23S rRNA (guanine(2445)-N(2))-methyltransferase RlmL [Entomospira nematocera]NIZ47228.1 bifunctional 23S rRNA (guanine(2069)-N(7))-methyltransferase RlmK/23S rRNA (guanine(2445)-N(2))-methyltransferase RlmL [Entomospira nematocera]WDI34230.1 bifunctional 23S rRNA (guanine(2069)-N(7))-methyltransferase RlmK/23S rRNA (guanine(2445)-N(2))-methyltransferase RlmL [Entomospira nematocera]
MKKLYYATCQLFFEDILEQELRFLGITDVDRSVGGVFFYGEERDLYHVLIHARTIASLRLVLLQGDIEDPQDLYKQSLSIAWIDHFSSDDILACRVSSSGRNIAPENFLMLVMKDGIVDSFRKIGRPRPNINTDNASHLVHLDVHDNKTIISLELEHELFKRGYRESLQEKNQDLAQVQLIKKKKTHAHPAPLKEHLSASLLYRAQWHELMQDTDTVFYDPMCGSGTLVAEAFMMAQHMSPHWLRTTWRIKKWKGFNQRLFDEVWQHMKSRAIESLKENTIEFWASDINQHAIAMTRLAFINLGCLDSIRLMNQDFFDSKGSPKKGLILSNPPYGERMGTRDEANRLYARIGKHVKEYYQGWNVALLAPDSDMLRCLDIRAKHMNTFFNGAKRALFLRFFVESREEKRFEWSPLALEVKDVVAKQFIHYQAIAEEAYQTNAFRFYNNDHSSYQAICEYFNGAVVVQEFARRLHRDGGEKDTEPVLKTVEFLRIIQEVTNLTKIDIYHKVRKPASSRNQYEKYEELDVVQREVHEGDTKFLVNFSSYIDVGLYLDHRYLRRMIAAEVRDKSFLNLFCYTASVSLVAALAGASSTVSVDISKTYLEQARQNFKHNGIDTTQDRKHVFIRNDVKRYVSRIRDNFDIVYVDPPTFSNGTGRDAFDVQREHAKLIFDIMEYVNVGGKMYFSTHYRRFKLDNSILRQFEVVDLSDISHDTDVSARKEHLLWCIQHKG